MKKWITENRLIVALTVVLFVAVSVMAYMTWLYDGDNRGIIYAFLRDVAAGCLVLIGAIALLQRAASQDKTAKATLQSNEQTIFKDGLAFLGSKSESVRLGGIYNLHELAIKNPKRSKDILEILCAHLRSKTNDEEDGYQRKNRIRPSVEISSLFELLAGSESKLREVYEKSNEEEYILNFQGAFLNGVHLRGAWLKGADLSRARMRKARLMDAQMQGAKFLNAQMQRSRLDRAQMQGVNLFEAQMQDADLLIAKMQGAHLYKTQMQGVNLSMVDMPGAYLFGAQMQGANLSSAQMQGADLSHANMQGTYLSATGLQTVRLIGAKLQGAVLHDIELQGVDLDKLDLRGVIALDSSEKSTWYGNFKSHMDSRRRKPTELNDKVIFNGGLDQDRCEEIKKIIQQISHHHIFTIPRMYMQNVLLQLDSQVGIEPNYEIPKGVITGVLNDDEVDKIIEEYEKAMAWKTEDAESD